MTAALRSELFRLSRRLMPRILLLISGGVIALFYLLFWSIVRASPEGTSAEDVADLRDAIALNNVTEFGASFVSQLAATTTIILAASSVATEYAWGTIRTLLPRTAGRMPLLTAKLITQVLFLIVVVVAGFAAALIASGAVTALEQIDSGVDRSFALDLLLAGARVVFATLPYLALAFLLAVWLRSSAAGIGIGLAVLFLEPVLLTVLDAAGGSVDWIGDALLSRNVAAMLSTGDAGAELPDRWRASAVLVAYTAVFLALAFWRFRTRDVTVDAGG